MTTYKAKNARNLLSLDTRASAIEPQSLDANNTALQLDFKQKSITGLTADYSGILSYRPYSSSGDWTGGPAHQIAFDTNGLHWHKSTNSTTWGSWRQLVTIADNTATGGTTNPIYINASGEAVAITAGTTGQFYRGDKIWSNILVGGMTIQGILDFPDNSYDSSTWSGGKGYATTYEIRGTMAANDQWAIRGYGTASDTGYLEIATGDNGNEAIIFAQYTNGSPWNTAATRSHTIQLMNTSGNQQFNTVYFGGGTTYYINGADYNGNSASATQLKTARTIWGQSFNGTGNISGDMTGIGPNLRLPTNESNFSFLTSSSGAANGKFGRILLSDNYGQGDISTYRFYMNGGTAYFNGSAQINGTLLMKGTNLIEFENSGSWGASSPTFPNNRGGLYWTGTSDWVKIFCTETASDNFQLIFDFGDDTSPSMILRDRGTNKITLTPSSSTITATTFSGSLNGNATTATTASKCSSYNLTDIALTWSGSYSTGDWMLIHNGETGANGGQLFRAINQANTAQWVDAQRLWVRRAGDSMTGTLSFSDNVGISATMGGGTDGWGICGTGTGDAGRLKIWVSDNATSDWLDFEFRDWSGTTYTPLVMTGNQVRVQNCLLYQLSNGIQLNIGAQNNGCCHFYIDQNVPFAFNRGFIMVNSGDIGSGTYPTGNIVVKASGRVSGNGGALYLGNSNNANWVLTQDICSHNGTGDTYWSARIDGTGHFKAVYGAVWNDYAEMRNVPEIQKDIIKIYDEKGLKERNYPNAGNCVAEVGNGMMMLTTKRLQKGCKIISDTFGFCIGETEDCQTPIAVTGRVLAYPLESPAECSMHIGDFVCSGPNGTVSIMTSEEAIKYPESIVGTISEIPTYTIWHCGNKDTKPIEVKNRIWIYVR